MPYQLLVRDTHKARVGRALLHVPLVQVLDVRDGVQDASRSQQVRVLGQQMRAAGGKQTWSAHRSTRTRDWSERLLLDNATAVVALLELRVREAEEHLGDLSLGEVVRQVAHGICSQRRYVLEL